MDFIGIEISRNLQTSVPNGNHQGSVQNDHNDFWRLYEQASKDWSTAEEQYGEKSDIDNDLVNKPCRTQPADEQQTVKESSHQKLARSDKAQEARSVEEKTEAPIDSKKATDNRSKPGQEKRSDKPEKLSKADETVISDNKKDNDDQIMLIDYQSGLMAVDEEENNQSEPEDSDISTLLVLKDGPDQQLDNQQKSDNRTRESHVVVTDFSEKASSKRDSDKEESTRGRITLMSDKDPDKYAIDQKNDNKNVKESVRVVDLRDLQRSAEVSEDGSSNGNKSDMSSLDNDTTQGQRLSAQSTLPVLNQSREQLVPQNTEAARFSQFLKEQGNSDLVRDARVILKDDNTGEIRLVLKPERLGEVRIRLSLEDNRIAGRIFVENNSVRDCFNNNLPDLLEEFKENGFDNTSLDVFVRQESDGRQQQKDGGSGMSRKSAALSFEAHVPEADTQYADNLVNMVV